MSGAPKNRRQSIRLPSVLFANRSQCEISLTQRPLLPQNGSRSLSGVSGNICRCGNLLAAAQKYRSLPKQKPILYIERISAKTESVLAERISQSERVAAPRMSMMIALTIRTLSSWLISSIRSVNSPQMFSFTRSSLTGTSLMMLITQFSSIRLCFLRKRAQNS